MHSSPTPRHATTTFDPRQRSTDPLRLAIDAATRRPETECVPPLVAAATLPPDMAARVKTLAGRLAHNLRADGPDQGVRGIIQEYSLSSEEGVALMCLAEALLRIPDNATRDALIRDKVSKGDWGAHLGRERPLFVNAATWGLLLTGKVTAAVGSDDLSGILRRLIARGGEPLIRAGVDAAMRMMGDQFVTGQTIEEALNNGRKLERRGFSYSYDMLGEAATTAADADRYFDSYRDAITAIGKAAEGRGPYVGPGISVKLSALHPRYRRTQYDRVMEELLPRLRALALLAKQYDIGFNIDAEEAERLDISLDLLEGLCLDPALAGWNGLGFVVQAYGRRCPLVIDWVVELARRSGHRIMVRLVKGAYWDSEIKQAQIDGLEDFPVFTRKVYSDVSYLACAKKLLAAPEAVFPQFATHNAQTLAAIYEMADPETFALGQYEFQCLHGMGEDLYTQVVGAAALNRPCRIYAPVGTHGTLLAYLVRRLLENGANTSFVNRISDPAVSLDALIEDPVEAARRITPLGAPHPGIATPRHILGARQNSLGLDLASDDELARLESAFATSAGERWKAVPLLADGPAAADLAPVRNPADHTDIVGHTGFAAATLVDRAFALATPGWAAPAERGSALIRAADLLEDRMRELMGLIIREAGKSVPNAIAEVRETVDFLRYYGAEATTLDADEAPLGTIVCISPWNFPLAIFTGQVAAALGAGNAVIAKPAEETTLVAAAMVDILHEAGIPKSALQFLPAAGDVGAALVAHKGVAGVVFTGSTEVARLIQRELSGRLLPTGAPVPLIAETGGINAMIVDSSALTEQVVADVLSSAFDSAGQRCSALRLLCVQDDVAERTLEMLKGAMAELRIADPQHLTTDIGPVITAEAADRIAGHIEAMGAAGHTVTALPLGDATANGTFIAPTLIELGHIGELDREVFGPVLHVVRYARKNLDATVDAVNALGSGLTFGLHTRLDETIARVTTRIRAGNIYVNRNIIGAVVGVQPFGGHGLSGTGPKAGGPLYLRRMLSNRIDRPCNIAEDGATRAFATWLAASGDAAIARSFAEMLAAAPSRDVAELPGPVGERNLYSAVPRGEVLVLPQTRDGLLHMLAAVFATSNRAVIDMQNVDKALVDSLPPAVGVQIRQIVDWTKCRTVDSVLVEGGPERMHEVTRTVSAFEGPIVLVQSANAVNLDLLVHEIAVSINTAAAGGNASLMALAAV
jgi:RHH-type proline utilization regulon transcriptional repressor/proline dehydrogenase/delta 1-pyrroline-5-carboxylate dehydrogenase